jgi:hypothetical protein
MTHDRYGEWPILLESCETRLVWVEAESHDEALKYASRDCYDIFRSGEPTEIGGINAALPDEFDDDMIRDSIGRQGPAPLCLVCRAYIWNGPDEHHDFECPVYRAGVKRYPTNPIPRVVEVVDLLRSLLAGRDAGVENDGTRIRVQVRPESVAQWQAWLKLMAVDPKKVRTLATYAHGMGRLGGDAMSSVDVILVGLGVPQLDVATGGAS